MKSDRVWKSYSSSFFGIDAILWVPLVISMPSSRTTTSMRNGSSLFEGPPAELGRLSSTIVSRENTAVISRNGTSTTMRFRNVVTSISWASPLVRRL